MKKIVLIVLDGFGIGAMDDVVETKPFDVKANTCKSIFSKVPTLKLPNLEILGLGNAFVAGGGNLDDLPTGALQQNPNACYGTHCLAHFGADTFWGHQELLGTKPVLPKNAPFSKWINIIYDALIKKGYSVRYYSEKENGPQILIVNESVTIGDNLETDPGNNYNVTAAIDIVPFSTVTEIGTVVRSLVTSSRVIVFGGEKVELSDLLNAFESSENLYAGVNAPKSGVYTQGYQVVHLGYGVDSLTQVPNCLTKVNIPTTLIGKVADIVENPGGEVIPCVDTVEVLNITYDKFNSMENGFICANVQETDLAGHREDAELYAHRLELADKEIGRLMKSLGSEDLLIVTADHGNDPTIGHSKHTRERTPLLVYGSNIKPCFLGERGTLADTGATVAAFFGAPGPQSGENYLKEIKFIEESL